VPASRITGLDKYRYEPSWCCFGGFFQDSHTIFGWKGKQKDIKFEQNKDQLLVDHERSTATAKWSSLSLPLSSLSSHLHAFMVSGKMHFFFDIFYHISLKFL
jgi:hypothetical protein